MRALLSLGPTGLPRKKQGCCGASKGCQDSAEDGGVGMASAPRSRPEPSLRSEGKRSELKPFSPGPCPTRWRQDTQTLSRIRVHQLWKGPQRLSNLTAPTMLDKRKLRSPEGGSDFPMVTEQFPAPHPIPLPPLVRVRVWPMPPLSLSSMLLSVLWTCQLPTPG